MGLIKAQGVKEAMADAQMKQQQADAGRAATLAQGRYNAMAGSVPDAGTPLSVSGPAMAAGAGQPPAMPQAGGDMFDRLTQGGGMPATQSMYPSAPGPSAPSYPTSPGMSGDMALRLAQRANLPIADQQRIALTQLELDKGKRQLSMADKEQEPSQIDTFDLPNGGSAVALRGSKDLKVLNDPNAQITTENIPDAMGNMHTIIRNPKTGAAMFMPAANTAAAQKLSVDSLVEAEKATRGIDEDIAAWHSQAAAAAKDKTKTAPDPTVLKDLQTRRARLQSALDQPNAGAAVSPGGAAPQPTASNYPPAVKALMDGASAAIKAGKDPAAVKARLATELKKHGYKPAED